MSLYDTRRIAVMEGDGSTEGTESGRAETTGAVLADRFLIKPGSRVRLGEIDPGFVAGFPSPEAALPLVRASVQRIDQLSYTMYAEDKHSLLIVLQGIDASGKDGVVRHLFSAVNPAGCRVVEFRQPNHEQLRHDFLWRVHPHVPKRGEMVVFNRSHYEDVLAVRVHQMITTHSCWKRYELINQFENLLAVENHTTVLKFLLYISKEEQLARFKKRLEDPARRWKISESDYLEREHWDDYIEAFEDMLSRTSTLQAPWFVIPSNQKWFRDLAVSEIIRRAMEGLNMKIPAPAVDIARIRRKYHEAEAEAEAKAS